MHTVISTRLDGLESLDEIRQVAANYSLSLDMLDLDTHVNGRWYFHRRLPCCWHATMKGTEPDPPTRVR